MKTSCSLFCIILVLTLPCLAQNPVPQVNQPLVPASVVPGGPGANLTVNGSGFVSGARINFNGSPRSTRFVSASQLKTKLTAADIAVASTAAITVTNPGAGALASNAVYLPVVTSETAVNLSAVSVNTGSLLLPQAAVVADFNRDGKPDAIVSVMSDTTGDPGGLSLLFGLGNGTFFEEVLQAGIGPIGMTLGDFNGDKIPDLAIALNGQNLVSIFLGHGDGSFDVKNFNVGVSPFGVVTGDFNRDGKLDLAVSNLGANTISVLLGNGDGTFLGATTFNTASQPFGLCVGDFNRDGKLDLVVASGGNNTVSVLLGAGDGTFAAHSDFPTGRVPKSVAAADVNGDGILDLVAANSSDNTISVLIGKGDGSFRPQVAYATGTGPLGVIAGDFNGDGRIDLATADLTSGLTILPGSGNGTFPAHTDYTTAGAGVALAAGDFTGNGRLDLIVPTSANTASVMTQ